MNRALDKLDQHWSAGRFVCVGLDPQLDRIPSHMQQGTAAETIIAFNRAIIEATADVVAAYKPNVAFYERYGAEGVTALIETVATIEELSPSAAVVIDAKRADIGSTNTGYVAAAFDVLSGDAMTVNPYLGIEALSPFKEQRERLMFVLCRTSNPGAGEFQDLLVDGEPLYLRVADQVARSWNEFGNFGLVVGATSPGELAQLRRRHSDLPLLIPGIGAQGGDVESVCGAIRLAGSPNILVNSSRAILYADSGFGAADAAREAAIALSNSVRDGLGF